MNCYSCRRDVSLVRRVKIRPCGHGSYPYRWTFICRDCYRALDTVDGIGKADGKLYRLEDKSRANRAPIFNRERYDKYQRREALKLGVDDASPDAP
jgi:hypothetical protein